MAIASLAGVTRAAIHAYTPAPEPHWLHTLGQIAGTLLLLELMLALALVCAIAFGLAFVAYWTQKNVVPVIGEYSARTKQIVDVGARTGDRIVEGVAEFHGRRMGFETALRVFFLGPKAAAGLARRPVGQSPTMPSEAPDALARPVTPNARPTAPTPIHPTQPARPTQPAGETRTTRRPSSPWPTPAATMTIHDEPTAKTPQTDRPTHGASPVAPSNTLIRMAPAAPARKAAALAVGRAGTPGGLRAGIAGGAGPLGFAG